MPDRRCPDDGACHHECYGADCFRVRTCAPLSSAGWGDRWPAEVRRAVKTEYVSRLPRRTAHVLHALLETAREGGTPATAREVQVYDAEALTATATGAALAQARDRGYCARIPPNLWMPEAGTYDLRDALEDRFLRETDGDG